MPTGQHQRGGRLSPVRRTGITNDSSRARAIERYDLGVVAAGPLLYFFLEIKFLLESPRRCDGISQLCGNARVFFPKSLLVATELSNNLVLCPTLGGRKLPIHDPLPDRRIGAIGCSNESAATTCFERDAGNGNAQGAPSRKRSETWMSRHSLLQPLQGFREVPFNSVCPFALLSWH